MRRGTVPAPVRPGTRITRSPASESGRPEDAHALWLQYFARIATHGLPRRPVAVRFRWDCQLVACSRRRARTAAAGRRRQTTRYDRLQPMPWLAPNANLARRAERLAGSGGPDGAVWGADYSVRGRDHH